MDRSSSITHDKGKKVAKERIDFNSTLTKSQPDRKLAKRNEGPVRQINAPEALQYLCTSYGQLVADLEGNYLYDESSGLGSRFYVIDTGAMLDNPVSLSQMSIRVSEIFRNLPQIALLCPPSNGYSLELTPIISKLIQA